MAQGLIFLTMPKVGTVANTEVKQCFEANILCLQSNAKKFFWLWYQNSMPYEPSNENWTP